MKAWRVHEFGPYNDVLRFEECPDPTAPSCGVVLDVSAAALNFPDILTIAGQYQVKAPLPFVPGIEACGVVTEAGKDSKFSVGDRVIANALWGAFGEKMEAPDMACFPAPSGMSDAAAAAFMVTYQTSYFALEYRARLQPGEVLLVHGGAGGVGTSCIQIGKAMGATVIATASSERKLQVCRDCGADHVINYREEDFVAQVKRLTGGRGADVIYDPVGGDVFTRSTKCVAFGGRILVIGFTSGEIPQVRTNRILLKNMSVIGLFWGAYQLHQPQLIHDTHAILTEMYAQSKIDPVICARKPLAQLPEALDLIRERASYGKVVVTG
jgi:NADPH:quinone reductase